MIDYNPKAWASLISHSYSRHVMRTLRPVLLFMGGYSLVCCYLVLNVFRLHEKEFHSTIAMHSCLALSLVYFSYFAPTLPTTGGGRDANSGDRS